jgi:hypothetical protein
MLIAPPEDFFLYLPFAFSMKELPEPYIYKGIIVADKLLTWPLLFVKLPMLARFAVFSNFNLTFVVELKFY